LPYRPYFSQKYSFKKGFYLTSTSLLDHHQQIIQPTGVSLRHFFTPAAYLIENTDCS
jgi:hypothetical protein